MIGDTHVKLEPNYTELHLSLSRMCTSLARGRAVAGGETQPDNRFVFLWLHRLINIHMLLQLSPLIKLPIDWI